jgi:penicillin-insensitive murein endopeptidase
MRTTTLFVISTVLVALSPRMGESAPASTCYGTTSRGRLENGVKLPARGASFQAYSLVLAGVGRTYVHSRVHDVVVGAYAALAKSHPDVVFVYGETGFEAGGRFKPHKTHRNGLSVDFMVPVRNDRNESVPLPTSPFNQYGYGIDFDATGRFEDLQIDFAAMAAHIKALHVAARRAGIDIWWVIVDPRLQPHLYRTPDGAYLQKNILIPPKDRGCATTTTTTWISK